jgi:hypothetical protein
MTDHTNPKSSRPGFVTKASTVADAFEKTALTIIVSITIFVNLGFVRHFETVTNIRTWIKSHRYWRML